MSNAISKQMATNDEVNTNNNKKSYDERLKEWENSWPIDYEKEFTNDRLVLCFEEIECDTGDLDMECFVLYDPEDKEYFICGKRNDVCKDDYIETEFMDFKFFCKSKREVVMFLKSIMDTNNNKINHVLYNYKDIFYNDNRDEYEYLDYDVLSENKAKMKELCAYDRAIFKKFHVINLLKMLKHVRY